MVTVVEDDPDIRTLIRMTFSREPEFAIVGEVESVEEGFEILKSVEVDLIVLDHTLLGELYGVEAAPLFKEITPRAKIILFTADSGLRVRAKEEPAIDAFLIKTKYAQLVPTARRLCGIGSPVD